MRETRPDYTTVRATDVQESQRPSSQINDSELP